MSSLKDIHRVKARIIILVVREGEQFLLNFLHWNDIEGSDVDNEGEEHLRIGGEVNGEERDIDD